MSVIKYILPRQIFDANGNEFVECDIFTSHAFYRTAIGCDYQACDSTSQDFESDESLSQHARVEEILNLIRNVISPALIGHQITNQIEIDQILSSLPLPQHHSQLGANISLAISMAVCRGGAAERNIPLYRYLAEMAGNNNITLPVPIVNVLNGGISYDNELPFKEFLIAPTKASSYSEAIEIASRIWHCTKSIIEKGYGKEWTNLTEKGGFAPPLRNEIEALELLMESIHATGTEEKVQIMIDVGADAFYDPQMQCYHLVFKCAQK